MAWAGYGLRTVVHRDAECDRLAVEFGIAEIYRSTSMNIQRADVCKYMSVYTYGGFSADMDVTPAAALEEWVPSDIDVLLVWEGGHSDLVQNHFFGSIKGHALFKRLILECADRLTRAEAAGEVRVHITTGPTAFTEVMALRKPADRGRALPPCNTDRCQIIPYARYKQFLLHGVASGNGGWKKAGWPSWRDEFKSKQAKVTSPDLPDRITRASTPQKTGQ